MRPGDSVIELEALEGEITVGGQIIQPGSTAKTRYPVRCALGEAEIEISGTLPDDKSSALPLMKIGAIALVFLLAASKLYFDMPGRNPELTSNAEQLSAGMSTKEPEPLQGELSKTAVDSFYKHLLSVKIDSISLKAGTGIVSATGTIDPELKDDWRSAQVWFDENFGQRLVLQSDVNALPRKPVKSPITIQSVWSGKNAYLIDGDGNKHFEGAVLRDGWVLEKIQPDRVLIRRDKEPLVLRY